MCPVLALSLGERLQITQVALGIVPCLALLVIYNQLRIHLKVLKLNAMTMRHQLYLSLTASIKEDEYEAMRLHLIDYFDPGVFNDKYNGNDERIRSYLLMSRKYLYLLYSSKIERDFPIYETGVAEKWIKELSQFHEFRDVHQSQKHYYPEFAQQVDAIIREPSTRDAKWMFDAHLSPSAS